MKNFNEKLTVAEAKEILKFKGQTMFVNSEHNKKLMASLLHEHLKSLR